MVRPTDGETTAIAKIVSYDFQKEGSQHTTGRATWGSTRVNQEAEGAGGKLGQEPLLWFPREGGA